MTPVGFEPTQLALVELESTPLDHSGKVSVNAVSGSGSDVEGASSAQLAQAAAWVKVGRSAESDSEGIRTPAGRAQWISSPSP